MASLSIKPFGHDRQGTKNGGAVPFWGAAGSPSNTMWPEARSIYLRNKWHPNPSSRLATIHQCQRQDRQRSDSIGQTILQMLGQKGLLSPSRYSGYILQGDGHF